MKKQLPNRNILPGILFCIFLGITAMAFQDSGKIKTPAQKPAVDTVPKQNEIQININMKDLEKTIQQSLAIAQKSLNEIDWNSITKTVEQSLKSIDVEKIKAEVNNSIKNIDVEKINKEINRSLKEIDKAKIQSEVDRALKNAMKNINTEELKKNLQNINKKDAEKIKKDMEKLKKDIERSKANMDNTTDINFDTEELKRDYRTEGLFYSI